jgi:Transposase DDE domain
MSVTSKSPLGVAREALAIGSATLRDFAHRFSPKTYTQPQLFACLVLKTFLKTDYRGICRVLKEWAELRQVLGLGKVPHYTTLQKASQRLLSASRVRRLLTTTIKRGYKRKRRIRHAALDSTGLACGHASLYYTRRRWGDGKTPVFYRRYAKLELATDCATHLILAALAGRGPRVDVDRFVPLLNQTLSRILLDSALADAGYDSEANHRYARETCGVRSFIPALHGRPTQKPPSGRYRRQMKQRLDKDFGRYGQRWQVETVCSMIKRRLSTYVAARSHWGRCRELMLLIVTHNTMILLWVCRFSTEQVGSLLFSLKPEKTPDPLFLSAPHKSDVAAVGPS